MSTLAERLREQKAGVGVFLALILLPAAALVLWGTTDAVPKIDPETSCPAGVLDGHRIVLIDATDKLEPTQRDIVMDAVENEVDGAAPYERVTILAVDEKHPRDPHLVLSRCAPQRDSTGPSENPILLRNNWLSRFHDPLLASAQAAMNAPEQKESPLIESIYGIARRPDFSPAVKFRRLVLVSDMLQNTAALYSQYREGLDFAVFARKPLAFQSVPDLSHVEIVNRYLDRPRESCIQGEAQKRFWIDYFRHANTAISFKDWPWPKSTPTLKDYCVGAARPHRPRHRHRSHIPAIH
jgi:hypothetical protein